MCFVGLPKFSRIDAPLSILMLIFIFITSFLIFLMTYVSMLGGLSEYINLKMHRKTGKSKEGKILIFPSKITDMFKKDNRKPDNNICSRNNSRILKQETNIGEK